MNSKLLGPEASLLRGARNSSRMIFEFAIDPQEIASWGSEDKYNRIIDAFGVGQPRIMARLPKRGKWLILSNNHIYATGSGEYSVEARITDKKLKDFNTDDLRSIIRNDYMRNRNKYQKKYKLIYPDQQDR